MSIARKIYANTEEKQMHTDTNKICPVARYRVCAGGQCCCGEIMRYMGGTDPIRAVGIQAKVSQVTNTLCNTQGSKDRITFAAFNLKAGP